MRRIPVSVLCALLVIAALFWVRSYGVADSVFYKGARVELRTACSRGALLLVYRRWKGDRELEHVGLGYTQQPAHVLSERVKRIAPGMGIDWRPPWLKTVYTSTRGATADEAFLVVPVWIIWLPIAAVFGWRALYRPIVRRVRRRRGQCADCGYDLRGSAERCPECGRRIKDEAVECSE